MTVPGTQASGYTQPRSVCQSVALAFNVSMQPGSVALNNILVAIAVFLIAVMTALFAGPRVIDWNSYRGMIEEEATRLLGRDVRVGGQVQVRLLPTPTFSVEQIRIADIEANSGEPFFRADAISGTLAIAPLFRGALQANEIVLKRPVLNLVYDDQGRGNWASIGSSASRLPFMPTDVALQSVRIEGGILAVNGAGRVERLRLEAIDGEFSATALDGPYRFRGVFGLEGNRRELRLTTVKPEPDGSVRFKAGLKHLDTGAAYTFDARAADLGAGPRIEGELTAQVPLPQFASSPGAAPAGGAAKSDEAPVEVKAALSADTRLVKLANLTLAFERMGRPQILTGEAEFDLGEVMNVRAALAAKWLDIDQLIGVGPVLPGQSNVAAQKSDQKHGPVSGLITLATRLNGFAPEQGQASLMLDVEQANLGAEPVSGLRLVLTGRSGETNIQEMRIGLPGGSRADLKGLMTGFGEETAFNGDIVLRGASLARFLSWSTAGGFVLDPARDGRFAMRSKLSAAPGGVLAKEFVGELAGTIVQGELGYKWGARREVSILVEGPQVDLRALLPTAPVGGKSPLLGYLSAGAALSPATNDLDAVYRVRAGQLILPTATYQDASADIEMRNGRVRIEHLRLSTDNGVTVDLEGDMPTTAAQPLGALRGVVSARDAAALGALVDVLGLPADALPERNRWPTLVPLKLAGTVTFGLAAEAPVSVLADGDLAATHMRLKADFSKGVKTARTARLDVSSSLRGVDAENVLDALFGLKPVEPSGRAAVEIAVDASGVPDRGLASLATWTADGLKISYRGKATTRGVAPASGSLPPLDLAGDVALEANDIQTLRRFWRASPRLTLGGNATALRARIETTADGIRISGITGRIGEAGFGGDLQIVATGDTQRLTGAVDVSRLHLSSALAALVQPEPSGQRPPTTWPETRFALDAFTKLDGEVSVYANRLVLAAELGLDAARFTFAFGPNRADVRDFEARGGGGLWTGGLKLEQDTDGGTAGTLLIRLGSGDLALMTSGDGKPASVSGPISGTLTASGKGLSPQDLAGVLVGRGSVTIGDVRVRGLTPAALAEALDAALKGPADGLAATLRKALTDVPAASTAVGLSGRSIPITVMRGVAGVPTQTLDTPAGRTAMTLTLDLSTLEFVGSNRIEAVPKATSAASWAPTVAAPGGPASTEPTLPPVVVTFAARAGALHRPKVETSSDALERELAVRKLERDTLELERLRKQDDKEKDKLELERRTQLLPPEQLPSVAPSFPIATQPSTAVTVPQPAETPAVLPAVPAPKAATAPPAPKPTYRPLSADEQKRLFGGN